MATAQLKGWDEWAAKLHALVKDAPRVAAHRATRAAQGVLLTELKARTQAAPGLTPRIRQVSMKVIGSSIRKGRNDAQVKAKVGYGVGRQTNLKSISIQKGTLNDYAGKRSVYRRYKITRSRRKDTRLANAFIKRATFRGRAVRVKAGKRGLPKVTFRPKGGKKFLGMIGLRRAKKIGKALSRKKQFVKQTRMRGVGIGKRNAHWLVFGSHLQPGFKRTVKNWKGTGRPHNVGKFKPYLMGILAGVLKAKASEAYQAAEFQMLKVVAEIMQGKLKQSFRAQGKTGL